jgi:hypothetical protein
MSCKLKKETSIDAKNNAVRMSRSLRNSKPKDGTEKSQFKAYYCEECDAWHVTSSPIAQSKPRHKHTSALIPAIP